MTCSICGYTCSVPGCLLCKSGICSLDQAKAALGQPIPEPPNGFVPLPIEPDDMDFNWLAHTIEAQAAQGAICFLKFTCALCGSRQTITGSPNGLHLAGVCEEDGFVTNIGERGGGFMLTMGLGLDADKFRAAIRDIAAAESAKPQAFEARKGSA